MSNKEFNQALGARVKDLVKDVNPIELAYKTGIREASLWQKMLGINSSFSIYELVLIAKALGTTVEAILQPMLETVSTW